MKYLSKNQKAKLLTDLQAGKITLPEFKQKITGEEDTWEIVLYYPEYDSEKNILSVTAADKTGNRRILTPEEYEAECNKTRELAMAAGKPFFDITMDPSR